VRAAVQTSPSRRGRSEGDSDVTVIGNAAPCAWLVVDEDLGAICIRHSDLVNHLLLPEKICIMLALMEAVKAG